MSMPSATPTSPATPTQPGLSFPIMRHSLDFVFEELPLITREIHDQCFFGARIDGVATIEFDDRENWQITDIAISADNQKLGAAGQAKNVLLNHDEDEQLIWMLMGSITAHYGTFIEEKIEQAMAEDRDYTPRAFRAA